MMDGNERLNYYQRSIMEDTGCTEAEVAEV